MVARAVYITALTELCLPTFFLSVNKQLSSEVVESLTASKSGKRQYNIMDPLPSYDPRGFNSSKIEIH